MIYERKMERSPKPTADDETSSGWLTVEVNSSALTGNMKELRRLLAPSTRLMAVVKANAYGHGLLIAARAFLQGGAQVLGVHSWNEADLLRQGDIEAPVVILGPTTQTEMVKAAEAGVEITLASVAALENAVAACGEIKESISVHIKVETGVNRQGFVEEEVSQLADSLKSHSCLEVVGLSSHFADIEDSTNHDFALAQMQRFEKFRKLLMAEGLEFPNIHMTCSAATLLFPEVHGTLARVGISAYGIWPSKETLVSFRQSGQPKIDLQPALTWKCKISQVREVAAGETVGYGRSWKAMADSRIAILPVGYSDGLPRSLGGRSHVLVKGYRAPLVGRICMNLCMVDVTHVPEVEAGEQAVLLGRQGDEVITAEMMAADLGTIAYEVVCLPGNTWNWVAV